MDHGYDNFLNIIFDWKIKVIFYVSIICIYLVNTKHDYMYIVGNTLFTLIAIPDLSL